MNRALDLVVGSVALPWVGTFGAVVATSILIADGRPIFFLQTRLGRGRRPFRVVKFRTMREGRVSGVGRVLRETGLDELPQLLNVLAGQMSLVGPRPLTAADVTRLGWDGPYHDLRWSVRPGILGPAQLRVSTRCHARITWLYDRRYVEAASLGTDLCSLVAAAACAVWGKRSVARVLEVLRSKKWRRT